jgi:hypothetical protein
MEIQNYWTNFRNKFEFFWNKLQQGQNGVLVRWW